MSSCVTALKYLCCYLCGAGGLCQGGALKEALRRYERLWLPLIAAQAGPGSATANGQQQQQQGYGALVPPLDVAFLWHLHRLQPGLYAEDCCQLKGRDGKSLQGALAVTAQQVSDMTGYLSFISDYHCYDSRRETGGCELWLCAGSAGCHSTAGAVMGECSYSRRAAGCSELCCAAALYLQSQQLLCCSGGHLGVAGSCYDA